MSGTSFTPAAAKRVAKATKFVERTDFTQPGQRRRFVGGGGAGGGTAFKISSIVSGQIGRYNAKIYKVKVSTTATGALTEANVGTLPDADNAIIWHIPEITLASAKHLLKAGASYIGRKAGKTSTGKTIILAGALPIGETASASTVSPSGTTAETTTWSRITNGTPLTIALATRAYYDTSGHHLYHFTRTFSFDAAGLLISMSAETRVTTDDATSCS